VMDVVDFLVAVCVVLPLLGAAWFAWAITESPTPRPRAKQPDTKETT